MNLRSFKIPLLLTLLLLVFSILVSRLVSENLRERLEAQTLNYLNVEINLLSRQFFDHAFNEDYAAAIEMIDIFAEADRHIGHFSISSLTGLQLYQFNRPVHGRSKTIEKKIDLGTEQDAVIFNIKVDLSFSDKQADTAQKQILLALILLNIPFSLLMWWTVNLVGLKPLRRTQHALEETQLELEKRMQQRTMELRESESRYIDLYDNALDMYVSVDAKTGKILDCNQTLLNVLHYTKSEIIGRSIMKLYHPYCISMVDDTFEIYNNSGEVHNTELQLTGHNETKIDVNQTITSVRDEEYNILYSRICWVDITEKKQAEKALNLAAGVFEHAREGIIITDAKATIIEVNEAFVHITGYTRKEVLGKNPKILSSGRQGKKFYTRMWKTLLKKGAWYGEIWNRRKKGEFYAIMQTISTVHGENNSILYFIALFSDITSIKKHQEQLEHIAHFDALTDLPNRILLADRLQLSMIQAERRKRQLAVVYLDLDGFKEINDQYGHDIGDELLVLLAKRMKMVLRRGDTLSRLGGDEFVAVLIDLAHQQDCIPMLQRLLESAAKPLTIKHLLLQVSASIGATFYPQKNTIVEADQLLRQADQAMYQAKLSGKNQFKIFDSEQDDNIRTIHKQLEQIRTGLNNNEFLLYYQPKVNMRSGKITGLEALIRWQHPERGFLGPDEFLPLIEKDILSIELGEWVLNSALAQLADLNSQGIKLAISVNIDAFHLQQDNFIERLKSILKSQARVDARDLELEILETSALEDLNNVSEKIQECLKLGIKFSLDDFGTGYSSLTYLKKLPAATLKIDQSFVRDMLDDPEDLAIMEGVLGLSIAFRRQIIAEGVETIEHGILLIKMGCEQAQGYAIAKPMPAEHLPEWIKNWRTFPQWQKSKAFHLQELPLLFASVEHRSWVRNIDNYIQGKSHAPILDHTKCRFGDWLENEAKLHYSQLPTFKELCAIHKTMHLLGKQLCQAKQENDYPVDNKLREQLYIYRNELLEKLEQLHSEIDSNL